MWESAELWVPWMILGTHVQGIKQLGSPPVDSLGSETRTKDLVSMGSFLFEKILSPVIEARIRCLL